MMSSFTFRRVAAEHNVPQDPESLFRDLKSGSNRVQFLWSHQADILRTYMEHKNESDIALELPTGCGKTLVGLCAIWAGPITYDNDSCNIRLSSRHIR